MWGLVIRGRSIMPRREGGIRQFLVDASFLFGNLCKDDFSCFYLARIPFFPFPEVLLCLFWFFGGWRILGYDKKAIFFALEGHN